MNVEVLPVISVEEVSADNRLIVECVREWLEGVAHETAEVIRGSIDRLASQLRPDRAAEAPRATVDFASVKLIVKNTTFTGWAGEAGGKGSIELEVEFTHDLVTAASAGCDTPGNVLDALPPRRLLHAAGEEP